MNVTRVPYELIKDAVDNQKGWCVLCRDFTRDNTVGDAENHDCPICLNSTAMGAERALLAGLL